MPDRAGSPVVVGAGYVGLVTAVGLTELGTSVTVVERDALRLESLRAGRAPFHEPGLPEALGRALTSGMLAVAEAIPAAPEIVLICVGTPIGDDGRSNLSQLRSALDHVRRAASPDTVLVIRSTLPVGASRNVPGWAGMPSSHVFLNPEFLRQGSALHDFRHPSRIVVGAFEDADAAALDRVRRLFGGVDAPLLVVDAPASDLIKNGSNAFLALKLSFANELAGLAEELGTDIETVLGGIAADPRIGSAYMRPSFGFGGSCLPKELQTLAVAGRSVGLPMHVTSAASLANAASQTRFADRIAEVLGGLRGRRVGLLGLAFKAATDDIRESPAVRLAGLLIESGARVRAFDPAAMANAMKALPELETVDTADEVFDGADAVVVATEWPEFAALDFASLRPNMRTPIVIDGRRLLDRGSLEELGYRVVVVGSARTAPAVAFPPS